MISKKINGTILNSYYICKRKTWLIAHEISPDDNNTFLELGRIIEEAFYKKNHKVFYFSNIKIDLIHRNDEQIIIGEIKKSSKNIKPAIMQVSFYLMYFFENEVELKGEILIPKERKKVQVSLTEEIKKELKMIIEEIENIINLNQPPQKNKIRFCKNCAYREFCWS